MNGNNANTLNQENIMTDKIQAPKKSAPKKTNIKKESSSPDGYINITVISNSGDRAVIKRGLPYWSNAEYPNPGIDKLMEIAGNNEGTATFKAEIRIVKLTEEPAEQDFTSFMMD